VSSKRTGEEKKGLESDGLGKRAGKEVGEVFSI
jgi:hypothetical protein